MDLTQISHTELLQRVEKLARTERKITHLVLWHLVEVESRHLYLDLGYNSLFKYMTSHLHYSEDAAYRRIQAARLLKKLPQLEKSIETGDLNLTQLHQVEKCLKKELANGHKVSLAQTERVLEQIQNKSSFETQKILAVEFDQPIEQHEIMKPQRDDSVRLELTFTEDQMKQLQHAKELLSHVLPNPTWAELIAHLATAQVRKSLGKEVLKTDKQIQDGTPSQEISIQEFSTQELFTQEETRSFSSIQPHRRKNIKITTRRDLLKKAQHQCEYVHHLSGRCQSRFQLQVDHQIPLARGGSNELSNLRILCQQHNLSEARRWGISRF